MNSKELKVLLVIEQCNPEWASVPLVGYNFYQQISQLVDATLVTHARNREAIEKIRGDQKVVYISESKLINQYYKLAAKLADQGTINWPLYHLLTYPVYAEFNGKVYQKFWRSVARGDYDLVHALTPMMPRYPVKLVKACRHTPFLLGPVNGGVPFPPGFRETARKENAHLNFLRTLGRFLIPGYRATYRKADRILSGSTYTLNLIKKLFNLADEKISLFYENGIPQGFFQPSHRPDTKETIDILFVGRLVPYKGADMAIEAISRLEESLRLRVQFTIVGDGSERLPLEELVREKKLTNLVKFAGWVTQQETFDYYAQADIFCFPSIREFGGAVVLEAMACGVPCVVVNNGGIGEYVSDDTGFKIDPTSREAVIQGLTEKLSVLIQDGSMRAKMGIYAIERAKEFEWSRKGKEMVSIYQTLIAQQLH